MRAGPSSTLKGKLSVSFLVSPPFILVVVVWLFFAVLNPIPFWQETGDYSWYALSHAFTLESKLSGFSATNHGYKIHPGIPFGLVSWLAFRLSTFGIGDSANRIIYALTHADSFWMWAKAFALVLNLAGVIVIKRLFREKSLHFYIASALYFVAIPAVFGASLLQLTNESFALPFITSFYLLTYKLLANQGTLENHLTPPFSIFYGPDFLSFTLGALAAVGISLKIYYAAPAVGLTVGTAVAVVAGVLDKKYALKLFAAFLSGFIGFGVLLVFFVIGWRTFLIWINWNYSMLSHSQMYGSGATGFMKLSNTIDALKSLTTSTLGTFPIVFISLMSACFITTIKGIRDKQWRSEKLPFFVALLCGISFSLIGLLKHYSQRYAIPLCATFPCLLLILEGSAIEALFLRVAKIALPILLLINIYQYSVIHEELIQAASAENRDLEIINNLPIIPGEKRVWGYFSPTMGGVVPLIKEYAGSAYIYRALSNKSPLIDIAPLDDRDAINWRYVIFPKSNFPTRESIPENLKQFDFASTKFKISETDKISELETFFLLTRVPDIALDSAK